MILKDIINEVDVIDTCMSCFTIDIKGVTANSKNVQKDYMFICVKGERHDGHEYIREAIDRGAAVIVIDNDHSAEFPCDYITVRNTGDISARLFSNYYGTPQAKLKIIGVTGTNGKTTVTHMLKAIYEEAGYKCALIGTITNSMTTPMPEELFAALRELADNGFEYIFIEVSSHALVLKRLDGIRFTAGIFTNLTPEHLDFHKTMEDYFTAKLKLFEQCEIGFVNYDDEYGKLIKSKADCDIKYYSAISSDADYFAENIINQGIKGIRYDFSDCEKLFGISSGMQGKFTVYNSLAAAACAYHGGIPSDIISGALMKLTGVAGRLEEIRLRDKDYTVFIDYAHTPDALENVLSALREIKNANPDPKSGRLCVLFGCGGDRDTLKRPIMGKIASKSADFVIITSDNSRTEDPKKIIDEILRGVDKELPYIVIENRTEAIKYAVETACKDDIILLAGKGHENYEIKADGRHPFNERKLVEKFAYSEE